MEDVDEPVSLSSYDLGWPLRFAQEADRLRQRLGDVLIDVEHIGSTAVPGLVAKPIVDVMVGVAANMPHDVVVRLLEPLGYEDCGGAPGRRYLRRRGDEQFNVQVIEHGGSLWTTNLRLRQYLRTHPEAVRRYADVKRSAASQAPMLLAYSKLKDVVITELLAQAGDAGVELES